MYSVAIHRTQEESEPRQTKKPGFVKKPGFSSVACDFAGHPRCRIDHRSPFVASPRRDDRPRQFRVRLEEQAFGFLEALKLVVPATSLGDVYSLSLYPAMSSHRALTPDEREAIGIGDGLIRISVGIEDPEDILADIDQALERAARL